MSIKASSLVWERTRAKGSNLLMLLAIADYAKDDGRWAWPSVHTLAWKGRLTGRAGRLILEKLVQDGEVWPEWDAVEQRLYLHVRCVCDWRSYEAEDLKPPRDTEKISVEQREKFSVRLAQLGAECHLLRKKAAGLRKFPAIPSSSSDPLDPSEDDPSSRARELPPVRPRIEAYVDVWNGTVTAPLPQCGTITKKRRQLLETVRLQVTPTDWAMLCAKVEASSFLRGATGRPWKASLDWLIGTADAVERLREGQYDDPPAARRPGQLPETAFTCPHDPPCLARHACHTKTQIAAARAS